MFLGMLRLTLWSLAFALVTSGTAAETSEPPLSDVVLNDDEGVRLKDLCEIYGARDNQLHGVGLVVGLDGTGDSAGEDSATIKMLQQMLDNNQINADVAGLSGGKSVALVAVVADLPPFAKNGSNLHTQVACLGDASSLRGGVLLQTPLVAADGRIYAVGQGNLTVGGYGRAGPNLVGVGIEHENVQTVATLTPGAIVEREVPATLLYGNSLRLVLKDSDFTTANRVATALGAEFGADRVAAEDASTIRLSFAQQPTDDQLVATIARLHELRVRPDQKARVVINSRTGTVVSGENVRISPVAVSHGGLSIKVLPQLQRRETALGDSEEVIVWRDGVTGLVRENEPVGIIATEQLGAVTMLDGASVEEISNALNALGARPRDMVSIFQAIHRAGALHAELVVM